MSGMHIHVVRSHCSVCFGCHTVLIVLHFELKVCSVDYLHQGGYVFIGVC